jgi:tRNA uridine 5-carboxymethylaminomethyl modification enzyme
MSFEETFDVIVIGAGHAGCEAASGAARMGCQTALITLNLETIGQMSCNPAIGGIAKGHIVRELDALGGIMGKVIDRTGIHFRLLNRSRGPAVQAPRAQADRSLYRFEMRRLLEETPNLHLRQGAVTDFVTAGDSIIGIELQDTRRFQASAVVLATGTFLNGQIHTGKRTYAAGRAGEPASTDLSQSLRRLGFPVGRLKTGTSPRLDGKTINWDALEIQPPDEDPVPFSFSTQSITQPQVACYIGYTNERVHEAIRCNIHNSPLYSGQIKSVGPRYCPSIEDKVIKFPEKIRHQLFFEPEGRNTAEVYLNGFSTSLPADLQQSIIRQIVGLEEVETIRPGYAIEYDFVDPRELDPYLQTTKLSGLYFAGQINGTTGYEEAACQGFIAGVNAALFSKRCDGFRLDRDESYIGVLIDDLINHGVDEPYRMFTSRAQNRLALRYDNADQRLSPYGRTLNLLSDEEWNRFNCKRNLSSELKRVLETTYLKRSDSAYQQLSYLIGRDLGDRTSLAQLLIANKEVLEVIPGFLPEPLCDLDNKLLESTRADLLYNGYIEKSRVLSEHIGIFDSLPIPQEFNYKSVHGLSHEMVERLVRSKPLTYGRARRLPGFTAGASTSLLTHLRADKD